MGSPFEQPGTQVAENTNGPNPFADQLFGSKANGAKAFEEGAQWPIPVDPKTIPNGGRAKFEPSGTTIPVGPPVVEVPAPVQTAQGRKDSPAPTGFSSDNNDLTRNQGRGNGDGFDPMWWVDRSAMLGSSVYAAHRGIPGAEKFLPASYEALSTVKSQGLLATSRTIGSAGREFLGASAKTDLGKVLGGSFVATSILDMTLLSGRETSWKTMAVDVATPLLANYALGKYSSVLKVVGITAAVHSAEKLLFEKKK